MVRMETFHEGGVVIADAGGVLAVSVVAKDGRPGLLDATQARLLRARLSQWLLGHPLGYAARDGQRRPRENGGHDQ